MATTPEIGWQGQPVDLNADAARIAQMFSQAASAASDLQNYAISMGANGIATATGWSTTDVTQFMTWCSYMHDLGAIFHGQQALASPFDYANGLAQLVGPPGGP